MKNRGILLFCWLFLFMINGCQQEYSVLSAPRSQTQDFDFSLSPNAKLQNSDEDKVIEVSQIDYGNRSQLEIVILNNGTISINNNGELEELVSSPEKISEIRDLLLELGEKSSVWGQVLGSQWECEACIVTKIIINDPEQGMHYVESVEGAINSGTDFITPTIGTMLYELDAFLRDQTPQVE